MPHFKKTSYLICKNMDEPRGQYTLSKTILFSWRQITYDFKFCVKSKTVNYIEVGSRKFIDKKWGQNRRETFSEWYKVSVA